MNFDTYFDISLPNDTLASPGWRRKDDWRWQRLY